MEKNKRTNIDNTIPWWIKSIVLILFTIVLCYKVTVTPLNLQFDFPAFLSLLLALFSVGLAALFYFKATETSNTFYDNTYKFTQEIANLLVKIESGFGEKLRHLDEAYKGMQERFDKIPTKIKIEDTKEELKQEEKELQKILKEREKLIQELVNKAQMREEEKQRFLRELQEKEESLHNAQKEIAFLRNRLKRAEIFKSKLSNENELLSRESEMLRFLKSRVIPMLGDSEEVVNMPSSVIKRRFRKIQDEVPFAFIEDLIKYDLLDEKRELTNKGVDIIRKLAF